MATELWGSEFMTLPRSRIRIDADGRVMRLEGNEPIREYVNPLGAVRRLLADRVITACLQQLTAGVESASISLAVFRVSDDRDHDVRELREHVERVWWAKSRPMITSFVMVGENGEALEMPFILRPDEGPLRVNIDARDDDTVTVNGWLAWPR